MSTAAVLTEPLPPKVRRRARKSPFFTLLGLLMLVLAIGGFWPQYFSAAIGRAPAPATQFWMIHAHAALFTAWLLVYVSQASLILTARPRTHLKMGPPLAAFGFAAAAFGIFAALGLAARFGERMRDAEAGASFVFYPMIDMVYFAGFLAVAVAFRKRPDIHKRAMFLATFSIAVVGLGRLVGRIGFESAWLWQPLNLAPLLLAIAYDLAICRKLYTVMAVGLLVHLARLNADPFVQSEWWLPLGRMLVAPFG
jgi:hypothetical protein